jgi:hypothetical protein
MSEDDSPLPKGRKPCPKQPTLTPSPSPEAKRAVPPSPARRSLIMQSRFLEGEAADADADDASEYSQDDRHLPDLSYVTQGSHPDGDPAFYMESLGSQVSQLGFGIPMNQLRHEAFRSSYDPAVRRLAGPNFQGNVCPSGHECRSRTFANDGHSCDNCSLAIVAGSTGERCKVCDFDLCATCVDNDNNVYKTAVALASRVPPDAPETSAAVSASAPFDLCATKASVAPYTAAAQILSAPSDLCATKASVAPQPVPAPGTSGVASRMKLKRPSSDVAVQATAPPPLTLQALKSSPSPTPPTMIDMSVQTTAPPPLTLQDLRDEMRALLLGLGF